MAFIKSFSFSFYNKKAVKHVHLFGTMDRDLELPVICQMIVLSRVFQPCYEVYILLLLFVIVVVDVVCNLIRLVSK